MTFAVINTGGKQYKVFANDEVVIEKLPNKVGDVIQFKEVLLLNNNDKVEIGTQKAHSICKCSIQFNKIFFGDKKSRI